MAYFALCIFPAANGVKKSFQSFSEERIKPLPKYMDSKVCHRHTELVWSDKLSCELCSTA